MFLALQWDFCWAAIWPDFFSVLVANTATTFTTPLISTIDLFMANLMSCLWFATSTISWILLLTSGQVATIFAPAHRDRHKMRNMIFWPPTSSSLVFAGGFFGALVTLQALGVVWGKSLCFIFPSVTRVDQPHQWKCVPAWADDLVVKNLWTRLDRTTLFPLAQLLDNLQLDLIWAISLAGISHLVDGETSPWTFQVNPANNAGYVLLLHLSLLLSGAFFTTFNPIHRSSTPVPWYLCCCLIRSAVARVDDPHQGTQLGVFFAGDLSKELLTRLDVALLLSLAELLNHFQMSLVGWSSLAGKEHLVDVDTPS